MTTLVFRLTSGWINDDFDEDRPFLVDVDTFRCFALEVCGLVPPYFDNTSLWWCEAGLCTEINTELINQACLFQQVCKYAVSNTDTTRAIRLCMLIPEQTWQPSVTCMHAWIYHQCWLTLYLQLMGLNIFLAGIHAVHRILLCNTPL